MCHSSSVCTFLCLYSMLSGCKLQVKSVVSSSISVNNLIMLLDMLHTVRSIVITTSSATNNRQTFVESVFHEHRKLELSEGERWQVRDKNGILSAGGTVRNRVTAHYSETEWDVIGSEQCWETENIMTEKWKDRNWKTALHEHMIFSTAMLIEQLRNNLEC